MTTGWGLVAALSPRALVRVADVDAYGETLNSYSRIHPASGLEPTAPWAVHLTDKERRYHLIAADFDAKPDATHAEADAVAFSRLLEGLGVPHVVCQSGPSGGRHVWLALCEPLDADAIAPLVRALRRRYVSLDASPLSNPATGAVRPPGAPHRRGGASTVIAGDIAVLTQPTVTRDDVRRVVEELEASQTPLPASAPVPRGVAVEAGQLRVVGARRRLSPRVLQVVATLPADGLASHAAMSVLCAAARASWSLAEVTAELLASPGLEYLRSVRDGHGRRSRPEVGQNSSRAVLERMWRTAIEAVATSPRLGHDPTFDARADAVAGLVAGVQERADGCPARWAGPRLAARLVLDAVCLLALDAVQDTVEASNRTIALMVGLDRETTRLALRALCDDGWLSLTRSAEGVHAHHYQLHPAPVIHSLAGDLLSQAGAPPGRPALQLKLRQRLRVQRSDAAAAHGLGRLAGRVLGLVGEVDDVVGLSLMLGVAPAVVEGIVGELVGYGLVQAAGDGWWLLSPSADKQLEIVAGQVGTAGTQQRRAALYRLERDLWAWWRAEVEWMRTPRRDRPRRRAAPTQLALISDSQQGVWGAHPRRHGRADFVEARRILCEVVDRGADEAGRAARQAA